MEKAEIERLIELASDVDRSALNVLSTACHEKFEAYKTNNSKVNLAEWQAAEKALNGKAAELSARYLDTPATRVLSNLVEVWRFLQSEGYKIGRQSVYNARDNGKLIVQADGTVTESDALAYAVKNLKKIKPKKGTSDKVLEERASVELAILRTKRARQDFEFAKDRGQYILKTDVRTEIAIKIAALEAGIKHTFRTFAADWISRTGGDAKKTPMLLGLINAEVDRMFNEFGRMPDIGVVIIKNGDDCLETDSNDDPDGGIFEIEKIDVNDIGDGVTGEEIDR